MNFVWSGLCIHMLLLLIVLIISSVYYQIEVAVRSPNYFKTMKNVTCTENRTILMLKRCIFDNLPVLGIYICTTCRLKLLDNTRKCALGILKTFLMPEVMNIQALKNFCFENPINDVWSSPIGT